MHAITFHQMRRKSNTLDDFLVNSWVNSSLPLVEGTLQDSLDSQILLKDKQLATNDLSLPDVGDISSVSHGSLRPSQRTRVAHLETIIDTYCENSPLQNIQDSLRVVETLFVTLAHATQAGEVPSS